MTSDPRLDEILGYWREHHVSVEESDSIDERIERWEMCRECYLEWPCKAAVVLAPIDAQAEALCAERARWHEILEAAEAMAAELEVFEARYPEIQRGAGALDAWRALVAGDAAAGEATA